MQERDSLKAAAYISFGVFVIMLAGAIYYYKERMLFVDAAHIAFTGINEPKLHLQQYRFGAFITQAVPIIGAKLGLSIRAIMVTYSASFNVLYLFVASILLFGFKAYRFLVLYAFYWVLVTTHAFFWPNNEVHQGIAYMFLFFPALIKAGEKKYYFSIPLALLLVLGTTALFCHPLVLPPFVFLWVYLIIEKQYWPFDKRQTIVLSIVVAIIVATKLYFSNKGESYDSAMMTGVRGLTPQHIFHAFSSPVAKEIYRHTPMNYWLLPILIIIGVVTLLIQRKFALAVWTVGCTMVYFILLCITFGGYLEFGTESELMPGIIIGVTPFVFVTLTSIRKELALIAVLFIFISRIKKFNDYHLNFTERVDHLSNVIAKMKGRGLTKLILVKKDSGVEWKWMADWGFPAESIMLSALTGDRPVRQFVAMTSGELAARLPKNNTDVILCFGNSSVEKLNRKYFPFDTTRPYTVVDYDEFMK